MLRPAFTLVSHLLWTPVHAQGNGVDQQSLLMHSLVQWWCYLLHGEFVAPSRGKMREAAGVHTHKRWGREEALSVLLRYFSKAVVVNLLSPQWDWLLFCLLSEKPVMSYRH